MTTIKVQKDVWNQITSYIAPDVPKLPEFISVASVDCNNLYNSSSVKRICGPHRIFRGRICYELYYGKKSVMVFKDQNPKLYEKIEAFAKYYEESN
mgnify:CR=1 FL=1